MSKWSGANLFKLGAGLFGAYQQYDAGKQAKKAADRNADRLLRESEEEKRRARRDQRQKQSSLRARAAASGIKLNGSTGTFLDKYVQEDEKQLSWLDESAKSQASIIRKQGKTDKKNAQYGAYGSFFNTVGNWWGGG
jgi:uncharacterized FAD-dependent dehydrogenase